MDQQETVRKLTEQGVLVTPEIMERVRRGEDILAERGQAKPAKLSVSITRPEKTTRLSTQDYLEYYKTRFESLKSLLQERLDAVSISNMGTGFSDVSVIGMVREKTASGFILEDTTGEVEVIPGEAVRPDDVIGATGNVREGRLMLKQIHWPDIPESGLNSIPGTRILLSSTDNGNLSGVLDSMDLGFFSGNPDLSSVTDSSRMFTGLQSPSHITIRKGKSVFRILFYRPREPVTSSEAVSLLRARHLSPSKKEITSKTDPYLIDPVPNIFWVASNQRSVESYHGVTVILTESQDSAMVDLESGEVFFAKASTN